MAAETNTAPPSGADPTTEKHREEKRDARGSPNGHATSSGEDEALAKEKTHEASSHGDADDIVYPKALKLVLIISALMIAVFLVALDQTIIAPALGAITQQFESTADIGWYGSAYLLTTTALQPTYGKLYQNFSVKGTFLAAVFVFEVGSLLTAVAPNSTAFIIGRAVAGIGTAGLFSGSVVILSYTLPLEKRPASFGLIGAMWGIASVAGPLLGGAFTDSSATWRWCFYINLPIGGLAMVAIFFCVNTKRKEVAGYVKPSIWERIKRLDLIGTSILIPSVVCLILALQWGGTQYPWNDKTIIGLFCGAVGLAIIFIGLQAWLGDEGTLPPWLFKNRDLVCATAFAFFFGAAFFPLIYYISLYFQAIWGDTAVQAGIKILPLLMAVVVTSVLTGGLITWLGYYNPIILPSMVLFAVGTGMITTWDTDPPLRVWFGYQVLAGLGVGVGFQTPVLVVQNTVSHDLIPIGSACVQFFSSLGGALFIAVAQTVFQNGLIEGVEKNIPGLDPRIFLYAGANQVRPILERMGMQQFTQPVLEAYLQGLRNSFYVSAAGASMAFVVALGLRWKSVKKSKTKKDAEAQEVGKDEKKAESEPVASAPAAA